MELLISEFRTLDKKQNQINIMINSKRKLQAKNEILNKILLKYQ